MGIKCSSGEEKLGPHGSRKGLQKLLLLFYPVQFHLDLHSKCKRGSEVCTKVCISLGFVSNVCQILRSVESLTSTHPTGSRCQQASV